MEEEVKYLLAQLMLKLGQTKEVIMLATLLARATLLRMLGIDYLFCNSFFEKEENYWMMQIAHLINKT